MSIEPSTRLVIEVLGIPICVRICFCVLFSIVILLSFPFCFDVLFLFLYFVLSSYCLFLFSIFDVMSFSVQCCLVVFCCFVFFSDSVWCDVFFSSDRLSFIVLSSIMFLCYCYASWLPYIFCSYGWVEF